MLELDRPVGGAEPGRGGAKSGRGGAEPGIVGAEWDIVGGGEADICLVKLSKGKMPDPLLVL